ncbi:nucleoporin NDC1 isoform X2 [Dunckerocampus dactyliophorus]|uniref:nucleoporin NDC1 isoform X2 n=1 Tax=Dunckerocampus dactyliophorus TaxID=161453 RepID=UPI002407038E|nr:nucleoporin NDC1 isoform X2 [Dunckerocampus dactyliophorus]
MFSDQSCWFVRKVICWRAAASIAWAVLLLPPTTAVFVILSRFSPLLPIQSISECLALMTSASTIFSFVLLCAVTVMVGFLIFEYYTVVPTIACSKIALLAQLLHPRHVVNSLVHCVMGIIVAWCSAVTIGGRYEMLGYPCAHNEGPPQVCLNEYHLVLCLAGAFVGFSHSLFGVIHNINYVSFHAVQQYKYLRFKGSLPLVVKCSATQALYSVRNYIIVYFFLGYLPREWICKTFNLRRDSSAHRLDTIAGLLDLSLLYHLWISATFLLFSWYITLLLFRIFVTEGYRFPVQSSFTEDVHQCLPKVLSDPQPAILKFLALQDLALLSQHSPPRRCEMFSLSQPGGHPHNWNAISRECLSLLTDLTQRLVAYHDSVATNGRAKSLSTGSERKSSSETSTGTLCSFLTSGLDDLMSPQPTTFLSKTPASVFARSVGTVVQSPLTAPFTPPNLDSPFTSPSLRRLTAPVDQGSPWHGAVQSPHVMRRAPKLWSTSTCSQFNSSLELSPGPLLKQDTSKPSLLAQFLHNRKEQVKSFLSKRVLIAYLFNKLPEASSEALFADSQAHIWALEGLSYLVQASFSEDHFGVVQTVLPSILTCMLLLQEAVDRHFKLPHASTKPVRTTSGMGDSAYKTLRFALRAALKTAIYRITTTFGDHLNAVHMSAEHRKRLQHFLYYKE